jgi:hypothetical protein
MWVVHAQGPVRVHNSTSPDITIASIQSPAQTINKKPKGLWYAIGGSWHEWLNTDMPQWEGSYDYLLDVNENELKIIQTQAELEEFSRQYGTTRQSPHDDLISIKWPLVATQWKGIEIPVHLDYGGWDSSTFWYYGWDVPSGCIWDASAIQSLELVQRRHPPTLEEAAAGHVHVGFQELKDKIFKEHGIEYL